MTTAAPSTALVTIQPAFTDAERLALAGYLAGYRGLTREAYALDLRQFTTWCRARSLPLFTVRRAGIRSRRSRSVLKQSLRPDRLEARRTEFSVALSLSPGECAAGPARRRAGP